ncbi:MAG: Iron(3+)-hydroxamate import ATP-binding protein FhuC [Firmicutes bacterium]|nr:Iron(3+)-hydroxamate import ATP-binding protein FhuC [Bacillota bacterium]
MPALSVENVSFRFTQPVLCGVYADFEQGTFSGILGANGVGKSTLVKLISRWLPMQDGAIRVHNRPLDTFNQRELARYVAVVPQEQAHITELTVREIVELGRIPHQGLLAPPTAADRRAVDDALAQTGLQGLETRSFATLSGGERQRVRVAMALAQAADILILDEPTSHLDIRYQIELLTLLGELVTKGYTVVAVLHDINLAALFCDHLVLLADGRVLRAGPPAEVITREAILEAYQCDVSLLSHPTVNVPQIALTRNRKQQIPGRAVCD